MRLRRYFNTALPVNVTGFSPSIIQCVILEPVSGVAMVGVGVLITGAITRAGSVTVRQGSTVLGAAVVSGLAWSFLWVPQAGDAGANLINAQATDAANGTTASASTSITVVAATSLPAGVTPLAWLRGQDAPMFADLGGTSSAPVGAQVRRVNQVSPLASYWQTDQAGIARREPSALAIEPVDPAVAPAVVEISAGPGSTINLSDSWLAVSWTQRYSGAFSLLTTGGAGWGVTASAGLMAMINGAQSFLFSPVMGARHSLVVRWTPTALKAKWKINGVASSTTITTTINAGHPVYDNVVVGIFQSAAYGGIGQALLGNGAPSDATADQLLDYVDSIPLRPAFPIDQPLIAATGDSNTVGVGCSQYSTPKFATLRALRAAYNPEMICTALVGTGVPGHAGYIAPFYDARRKKHVAIFAAGTNDIANLTAPTTVALVASTAFAEIDAMRAQGWRVILRTVQDRNDAQAAGNNYRTNVAALNTLYRDGAALRGIRVVDVAAIPQLGSVGAADNTTYFSGDKIHFNDAGQALIQAPEQAAIQAELDA